MNHPPKPKKKKGKQSQQAASISFKEKFQFWVWGVGALAALVLLFHFLTVREQSDDLNQLIDRWRSDYHLNEEQARQIRAMEEKFHGDGDPLYRPAHSQAETREHHRAMASIMNREDGERFFKDQEGVSLNSQP